MNPCPSIPALRWTPTNATIERTGGPERVATEPPPEDWKPYPLLGFGTPNASLPNDTNEAERVTPQ